MASVCARAIFQVSRRSLFTTAVRLENSTMPDPIEHATGIEKRELLARVAGDENPFDMRVIKRAKGTHDSPNQVPSAYDSRIVGCICDEEATTINWMWLHQGNPKRCACGHWFQLVFKAPV